MSKLQKLPLERITRPESGTNYLIFALFLAYSAVPLVLAVFFDAGDHYVELALVSVLSVGCIGLGVHFRLFDRIRIPHLIVVPEAFIALLWTVFFLFAITAWITAKQIPLFAALSGADSDTIAVLREQFLKAREGWQASFVYINAILSGALIPYSIALMFVRRMPLRWLAFGFFLFYCISFVEKAFFLKAILPLFVLAAQRRIRVPVSTATLLWLILGLLVVVTILSGAGSIDSAANAEFFSSGYVPQGPFAHLIWRSIAIPLVTAADAIRVLNDQFGGRVLWGATSSLIAGLTGMEHIEFERLVFAAQWGQNETGTGSSNSVFFTEAYVNYGWVGVAIFSFLVGLFMRFFAKSNDEAFQSLWLLFAIGVFTSGLIGLLFSNGFILLFGLGLFTRFRSR